MGRSRTLMRILVLAVIFVAVGFALYNGFIKDKTVVKIGEPAPNFVLPKLGGGEMQLADLKGQGVVLNFWGTWCDPCRKEMPALEQAYQQYKDKGVLVIGVNIGESEVVVSRFIDNLNLTFPMLMDKKAEITNLYEVGQIPSTYFINPDGVVNNIIVGGPMSEEVIVSNIKQIQPQ